MELWHFIESSYDRKGIGLKRLGASVVVLVWLRTQCERNNSIIFLLFSIFLSFNPFFLNFVK
jgi:hypothetical protein